MIFEPCQPRVPWDVVARRTPTGIGGRAVRRATRALGRVAILVVAIAAIPAVPVGAQAPADGEAPPAGSGAGADGTPDRIVVDELLVCERLGEGGRSAVFTDPVESRRVRRTLGAPAAGDEIRLGDESATWRRLGADAEGRFEDAALRGGYGLAWVQAPADEIWLLAARGHRHVFVNGVPRVGDVYDQGITRLPVPLVLGRNELLFRGGRGRLEASLERPPRPVFLEELDPTLPDVVRGEREALWAGIIVTNATRHWQRGLSVRTANASGGALATDLPDIPALSVRKVPVRLLPPVDPGEGDGTTFILELRRRDEVLHRIELAVPVRNRDEAQRRTFISSIDDSVQYHALLRPAATPVATDEESVPSPTSGDADSAPAAAGEGAASAPNSAPGLVLTLHGAGVEAISQVRAYDPKAGLAIVAPTNRRPFGFDWELWGRLDALEVLVRAERLLETDPRRTYLTGHSMGGHGTWQLGVHFPGRFAAIAPSAGWRDFWSYGGAREWSLDDPVEALMARATNPSRTLELLENLRDTGIYILHGDADETVPVAQARFLRERLAGFHEDVVYHEQPGAGHWWGDECVDWPPLFDFLRAHELPELADVRQVRFTTVSPAISSHLHWLAIESQFRPLAPSTVDARHDPEAATLTVATENVRRLRVDVGSFASPGALTVTVDGQGPLALTVPAAGGEQGTDTGSIWLSRRQGVWQVEGEPAPWRKGPHRYGPFAEVFRNHVLLIYGTRGTAEETAWAFARARYDAETFWYRGNGALAIIPDVEFRPVAGPDRNLVLYGNRDTNAAWPLVFSGLDALDVKRGRLRVGERELIGPDLACLFVHPRAGSPLALAGAVTGTGLPGMRLTENLPYFVSGVGYPDWTILDVSMLETGAAGIRACGYFDDQWQLDGANTAWREE